MSDTDTVGCAILCDHTKIPRASVNLRAHLPVPAAVDCVSRYSLLHHSVCGDHIILCRGLSLPKNR